MSLQQSAKTLLPTVGRSARLAAACVIRRRLPFSVSFILTHRCNFQCVYCDIPGAAAGEMTAAEFCRAIDELADAGLARASFSGGEALIRRDTPDIIAHAHAHGLFTSLNSNAWLLEKHLPQLRGVLDMVVISLDGPQAFHDAVRRREGSYERVIGGIVLAREAGLQVATITVLSKSNLHVVEEVLALAQRHGFWAYFQPAYNDCFDHKRGLDAAITPSVLQDLARRLDQARALGQPVAASPGFTARLARGPNFGDCGRCNAGRYFGTVMPDGTVVPCHLVSREATYPNGREVGFARAFETMPHPIAGPGCAISPYQEMDLIFALDPRAITAALRRMVSHPGA
jgi:MoaA/NifB/PqqE/SkfB family radical SAM enzyme